VYREAVGIDVQGVVQFARRQAVRDRMRAIRARLFATSTTDACDRRAWA
jgi:hypothetical protein